MRIIDEIRRQRTILGLAQANRVILSHSAFEQLLAEGDELGLHQFNTQAIPPTVYGMSISIAEKPDQEVAVLAGAPVVGPVVPDLIGEVSTEEASQSSGSRLLAAEKPARGDVVRLSVELELLVGCEGVVGVVLQIGLKESTKQAKGSLNLRTRRERGSVPNSSGPSWDLWFPRLNSAGSPVSENIPSETVWKIQTGPILKSHERADRDQQALY
jgi:hypothetical protein